MAQLTLRTLLAYIDDTLKPRAARELGAKVAESEVARQLIERIKKVTRRRGLRTPTATSDDAGVSDPNTVAEYLSNTLDSDQVTRLEETCLESDVHLAEVAACHQILSLVLTEPVRVPPRARQRMYQLVKPPASLRNRRPSKNLPIAGVLPNTPDQGEVDDHDAPLLLGMGRYGAGSVMRRLALAGVVVGLSIFLGIAVLMALPHGSPEPPPTSLGSLYAAAAPLPPPKPKEPDAGKGPVTAEPKPKEPDTGNTIPPPKPAEEPKEGDKPKVEPKDAKLDAVKKVAPPRTDRVAVGKVEGLNAIVLTRPDNGPRWLRLDPAGLAAVTGQDQVLGLPGYKADVALETGVRVHLWGNVPELLPARLLETRLRFHFPERKVEGKGQDFDADLTLLAGRVYLSTTKPAGARVRVRAAGQVWDVTLPDNKSEALVEVITAFEPGLGAAAQPRVEAQLAVVRGAAGIAIPGGDRVFEKIPAPTSLAWDSKTGTLTDPKPIDPGNGYYDKFLTGLVASDQGRAVQRALTQMAGRLTDREGVRLVLAEYLTEPANDADRVVATRAAVYGQAAIATGEAAGDELKPLIDLFLDDTRGYARLAVVNALAAWIAQAPGNPDLLQQQLAPKLRRDGEPENVVRLLRGYVNPANPDPAALDRLVNFLTDASIAIRELALWNLVNFVDPSAARPEPGSKGPILIANVEAAGRPEYERFVKAWRARVEEIKTRPPMKK